MGKNVVLAILSIGLIMAVAVLVYERWPQRGRYPKRVWVSYSEKTRDAYPGRTGDNERDDADRALYGEEQLMWEIYRKPGCMVLTRDRRQADYIAVISVIRLFGGGDRYGEASLSIQEANGQLVTVEHFYQGRGTSYKDIAQQPLTALWQALCEQARRR